MLRVKYARDVPPALVDLLEHHARDAGLSLEALETIGASLDAVEAFIVASEDGALGPLLQSWGLAAPTEKVARARWQAARLFGA
jgi:hypothetical protein